MEKEVEAIYLFKKNNDYIDIAAAMGITEQEVERLIHRQRTLNILASKQSAKRREAQNEWMRKHREELREIRDKATGKGK